MKIFIWVIGIALGALAGLIYWQTIGCSSGTCAITSNWHTSTLYGSFMGFLVSGIVTDFTHKKKKKEEENDQ